MGTHLLQEDLFCFQITLTRPCVYSNVVNQVLEDHFEKENGEDGRATAHLVEQIPSSAQAMEEIHTILASSSSKLCTFAVWKHHLLSLLMLKSETKVKNYSKAR